MKKLLLSLVVLFLVLPVFSQDENEARTIFDKDITYVSGFGGPMMNFSTFDKKFAFFMGGGGAVLLNHKFYFGGMGYGMTTLVEVSASKYPELGLNSDDNYNLSFGYGGLWAGYVIGWKSPVHVNLSLFSGWGGISVMQENIYENYLPSDEVFVFIPSAEIELNVTQFLRLGIGANYRYVTGSQIVGYNNSDFSSPSIMLNFKFGGF